MRRRRGAVRFVDSRQQVHKLQEFGAIDDT